MDVAKCRNGDGRLPFAAQSRCGTRKPSRDLDLMRRGGSFLPPLVAIVLAFSSRSRNTAVAAGNSSRAAAPYNDSVAGNSIAAQGASDAYKLGDPFRRRGPIARFGRSDLGRLKRQD